MTSIPEPKFDIARYSPLGLVANPFIAPTREGTGIGVSLEVAAAANRLLREILVSSRLERPKPIVVTKSTDIPTAYPLRAISLVEASLGADESLNVTYAYIQLYMMRKGRVRSTLGVVGERIAFKSFEHTLAAFLDTLLDTPDDSLPSYQVMGPERLEDFVSEFRSDPLQTTLAYFGDPAIERRPELAEVADIRLASLAEDVDEGDDSPEIDTTVGDALGSGIGSLPISEDENDRQPVVDYLIEYISTHLSKVVARGLRVYRERGLAAMSTEWRVTKAPRKTLTALAEFAAPRFEKLVVIYDSLDGWPQIAPELRRTITLTLSEMRWLLEETAVFVFLLDDGVESELEEQFSAGPHVEWGFTRLASVQKNPDVLEVHMVDDWLASASSRETPMSLNDPVLAVLQAEADGSLAAFVAMAAAAIEDAAERGVTALDDSSLAAGRAAGREG